MVFKKLQFRRGSRQNTLNELLVGNFLNLLTLTKILLFVCVSLVYSVFHAVAGWGNAAEDGTRYKITMTVLYSLVFSGQYDVIHAESRLLLMKI